MRITSRQEIYAEEVTSAKALGQGLVGLRNSRRQEWLEQRWGQEANWADR